jgi:hypothetical protein
MASLPSYVKILFDGYQQQRESGILRTEFESGPPRQARFKSRVMVTRSAKLYINGKTNFASFESWFMNDIKGGSLFFTMTDPASGSSISARFVGGTYNVTPLSSKWADFEISCQLENWSA